MSAFCSTRRMLLVNENISTSPKPSITARPSADDKRRFAELATRLRVSESTLALIAIRSLLDSEPHFGSGRDPERQHQSRSHRLIE